MYGSSWLFPPSPSGFSQVFLIENFEGFSELGGFKVVIFSQNRYYFITLSHFLHVHSFCYSKISEFLRASLAHVRTCRFPAELDVKLKSEERARKFAMATHLFRFQVQIVSRYEWKEGNEVDKFPQISLVLTVQLQNLNGHVECKKCFCNIN